MIRFPSFFLIIFFLGFQALFGSSDITQVKVLIGGKEGKEFFIHAIEAAAVEKQPVIIGAFKLHKGILPDKGILEAIKEVASHKVPVKVILESRLSDAERRDYKDLPEDSSLKAFESTGAVLVSDLPSFANVHLKLLLRDKVAIVSTTNYDGEDYSHFCKRDFSMIISDPKLVQEIRRTLDNAQSQSPMIWPKERLDPLQAGETRLAWSVYHRQMILDLIQSAKQDIAIYQQSLQDGDILQALLKKQAEGVAIRILMSKRPFGKGHENKSLPNSLELIKSKGERSKSEVRLTGNILNKEGLPLHIHAKALIIDGGTSQQAMYLGSANFYRPVLDPLGKHFNLGIITKDAAYIGPVYQTFEDDWLLHEGQGLEEE